MAIALPVRKLILASAILLAGTILAVSPTPSSAQGLYGWGHRAWGVSYPSWGYAVGMPGYYADFRAQSYYAAPWIAGHEAPWYSPGGCGYGYGYGGGYCGMGRYPWIWNRHAGFVTRGIVTPSPPASIKVVKNPFYKPGESSPSDAPKSTSNATESKSRGLIRVVSNPYFAAK